MRDTLEQRQIAIYLSAIGLALALGLTLPAMQRLSVLLEPALAIMMFATFLQLPLARLKQAFLPSRFLAALLCANFLLLPLAVLCLGPLMPDDPVLRFGILLVLLAPCIDYVIVFSHLGRANASLLLAATPVLLLAQLAALPLLLPAFLGSQANQWLAPAPLLHAFVWLILAPLLLAWLAQRLRPRMPAGMHTTLDLLPVPATAAVLFVVAASIAPQLAGAPDVALAVLPAYLGFAVLAPLAGALGARLFRLPADAGRAVAFSTATRNSLVVLPIGLAVPQVGHIVAIVMVTQTLVELLAELVYIRGIPRLLPDRARP